MARKLTEKQKLMLLCVASRSDPETGRYFIPPGRRGCWVPELMDFVHPAGSDAQSFLALERRGLLVRPDGVSSYQNYAYRPTKTGWAAIEKIREELPKLQPAGGEDEQ